MSSTNTHSPAVFTRRFPSTDLPPPDQRPLFAEQIRHALEQHMPFTERIRVAMLVGRIGAEAPLQTIDRSRAVEHQPR
ncbi:hypothetical protein [Streptosporangium sp. NBC_01756]|uniref:hypothetical protein n=1 Tax=Streptosporangium sp. NBC_01756 TaxID=2975950 RepID=UPI002DDA4C79|nr:hypothetical protein [Streptosporangium sp. NBC_01756]WSC86690.1 hypothetical protein OIE48_00240 [Streptosporangium sp. NBC_01756]